MDFAWLGKLLSYENGDVTLAVGKEERRFEKAQIAAVHLSIV